MAIHTVNVRVGTTAEWADTDATDDNEASPVLAEGEVGVDITLGEVKVGDGSTAFPDLDTVSGAQGAQGAAGAQGAQGAAGAQGAQGAQGAAG